MKKLTFLTMLVALSGTLFAQSLDRQTGQNKNYISTGMPIILIAPDAISSGMGDVGAATTPDAYSAHWNNAKLAFIDGIAGVYTTYTPWLRKLKVGDMNLFYLAGYYRINDRSTAAASLTYFTLGDIDMTDIEGQKINTLHPNEFAIDASYALKLNDNLSLGATGRFLRSDLTNGQTISDGSSNTATQAANSLAADIGLYYQQAIDKTQDFALGAFISNLGAKLSYSDDDNDKEFLPANLRIGGRYTNRIDEYNKISVMLDLNKLLVPTRPTRDGRHLPSLCQQLDRLQQHRCHPGCPAVVQRRPRRTARGAAGNPDFGRCRILVFRDLRRARGLLLRACQQGRPPVCHRRRGHPLQLLHRRLLLPHPHHHHLHQLAGQHHPRQHRSGHETHEVKFKKL